MIDYEQETEKKKLIVNRPTWYVTTRVSHEVLHALLLVKRERNVVILWSYCSVQHTNNNLFRVRNESKQWRLKH